MTQTALILAAHGSHADPSVSQQLHDLAHDLRLAAIADRVAISFHQGDPPFSRVLDDTEAERYVVIPFMASEGYYTEEVLPRELRRNRRFADSFIRLTRPVGVHIGLVELAKQRVRVLEAMLRGCAHSEGLAGDANPAAVLVVGHGTPRNPKSRISTIELAQVLSEVHGNVDCAFLDDQPTVEEKIEELAHRHVLVIPMFMSNGPHTVVDLPRRLGLAPSQSASPPLVGRVGSRMVVCDSALGAQPEVVAILKEMSRAAFADCGRDGIP